MAQLVMEAFFKLTLTAALLFNLGSCASQAPPAPSSTMAPKPPLTTASTPTATPTPSATVLTVAPFKIELERKGRVGPEATITGDKAGKIIIECQGKTRTGLLLANGSFQLEGGDPVKLEADGSVLVNGKPTPVKVGEDGAVSVGEGRGFNRNQDFLGNTHPGEAFFPPVTSISVVADQSANRAIALVMWAYMSLSSE